MSYNVIDSTTNEIVEGGFFGRDAAEACCADWNDAESTLKNRYYVRDSRGRRYGRAWTQADSDSIPRDQRG